MSEPVTVLVLGAGARGTGYSEIVAANPDLGRVVAVADPNPVRRERFAARHGIPADRVFESWQDALAEPRLADLALVSTQDADHVGPAVAAAGAGYHIMLEKPIAPTEAETRTVVAAVKQAGVLFGVCHVMRYTPHTVALMKLLAEGAIGDIVSVEHLEPVGWWHAAHSFVRGNWRREDESSPMLLAKSCHDLDWLRYVVGRRCLRVTSFGALNHFNRANQPEGAADRCLDCPVHIETVCPYSATRIYLTALATVGGESWPVSVLTEDPTEAGVMTALREGPYGRCVYACDNDVVDHQVVSMEFEGGVTASFTMTDFSTKRGRNTRIFGTHGELETDSRTITVDDFVTGERRVVDTAPLGEGQESGHGGGDAGMVLAMLRAVQAGDQGLVSSDADESLESHLMVFSAETARRQGTVETVRLAKA